MSTVDPAVFEQFDAHQRRAIAVLGRVLASVQVGMSEADIEALCREEAQKEGFNRWYHPPEVAIGARAASRRPWTRASGSVRANAGDIITIDIGPATDDAYGDIGTSMVVDDGAGGVEEPEVVTVARECVRGCVGYSSHLKTVGEIYVYAKAWAVNHAMELLSDRAIGHAILPKGGVLAMDWPRSAHTATWLKRHQVHFLNPNMMDGIWAFRPSIGQRGACAAFEEIVVIDGDEKHVLGRDSIDDIATYPV